MKRVKKRVIFVTLFIIAFAIYSYINVRGEILTNTWNWLKIC